MFKKVDINDIEFISKENDKYDKEVYRKICEVWNDVEPEHITDDFVLLHNMTTKILNSLGKISSITNGLTIVIPFYITQYKPYLLESQILNQYINKLIQVFIKYNKNNTIS